MESSNNNVLWKTIAGIPLALIVWSLVYMLAHAALYLLDTLRGLDNDWLQSIFREWFTPGVGGYTALHIVNKYLKGANLKWVSIFFGLPLIIFFIAIPLYIMVFHSVSFEFSWGDQIMQWGMAIASSIGAYIAYKSLSK